MKRLHILTKPTAVNELDDVLDADSYSNAWPLKAERIETKRLRKFKQQLA